MSEKLSAAGNINEFTKTIKGIQKVKGFFEKNFKK